MKALLVAALALFAGLPAPADCGPRPRPEPFETMVSVLGKLTRDVYWAKLPDPWDEPQFPEQVFVWRLEADGVIYRLDFGGADEATLRKARGLLGKAVRVDGALGARNTIRVLGLAADEHVRMTYLVEARGTLHARPAPGDPHLSNARGDWPVVMNWALEADGHTYTIRFGDAEKALAARGLDGKAALVRGSHTGDGRLEVTSVRADDGGVSDLGAGRVEIRGTLTRRLVPLRPLHQVHEVFRALVVYEVTADGHTYPLTVGPEQRQAADAVPSGSAVVVTAHANDGVLVVETVNADRGSVRETVRIEVKGTLSRGREDREGRCGRWELRAGDELFRVRFARPDVAALAGDCDGRTVTVTGTWTATRLPCDGVIDVDRLVLD